MQHHHTAPHFIRSPIAQAVMAALLAMPVTALAGSGSCNGLNGATFLEQNTTTACTLDAQGDRLAVYYGVSLSNSQGAAVSVTAAAEHILNNGIISGSTYGISVDAAGSVVGNYGVQNNPGAEIQGGIINNGTITQIRNGGTITGDINNLGAISYIANTGIVNGNVALKSTALYLDGDSGRVIGTVTGDSSSSVHVGYAWPGGTFTTEGSFNVGTFVIESHGTLNMRHSITTASGLNNHGMLFVADGAVASVHGDYTQDGVLSIGASSVDSYGTLRVSGSATLNSGASFNVNVATTNTLAKGHVLSGVLTAGTITNNAGALTVSDNSNLFNFTAAVNGNQVDITTVAAGGGGNGGGGNNNGGPTVVSDVTHQGFNPGLGAAHVLDTFVQGGTILTGTKEMLDFNNVVTALGTLATEKEVSDAVAQTLPLFTAGMNQVATNTMHGTNRVIQARQEGNHGASSGDEFLGDKHIWLKPVGSWSHQNDRKGVAGYSADTYGMIGGADGEINDSTRIGVALSYMHSSVDGKSTSSGNSAGINAYQAIVYGSHTLAVMPDTEVNWQADLGTNRNKGRRAITFGGLNRVASADYDSTTLHIGAGIARHFAVNDKTTITPAIRADYTWIRDQGYSETGAGALNLNVAGRSTDELIVLGEGRLSHKLNDKTSLVANAGLGYDVLHGTTSLTASYVGGGTAFTTQGMNVSPWLGRVGAGVVTNVNERTEISARYDAEVRSGYLDNTASVKVRWAF